MKSIILILTFAIALNSAVGANCPQGWGQWKHKCYWSGGRSNFEANKQICIEKGSELVSIENGEENTAILKFLKEKNVRGDHWLSAKRIRLGENRFQWSDGSLFTYTNWYPGEPAEIHKESAACVIYGSDGRWWDVPCEDIRSQMCQIVSNKEYKQFNLTDYLLNITAELSTKIDNNTYEIQAIGDHLNSISQTFEQNLTQRIKELRTELMNEMSKQSLITVSKLNKFVSQQHRSEALTQEKPSAANNIVLNTFIFIACFCSMIISIY